MIYVLIYRFSFKRYEWREKILCLLCQVLFSLNFLIQLLQITHWIIEYEIIIEDEKIEDKASKLSSSDETELKEFEKILKAKNPTFQDDETITESLEESVADIQEDKMFLKFKEKIDSYPDQVLRYGKGETPLWVSDSNTPSSVPDCEYCGSERRFEFQVNINF